MTLRQRDPTDMLLKDYDTATQLTYHVDNLRDRLSVFFVTIAGIAAAGLSIVLKDPGASSLALDLVAALFLLVGVVGAIVVAILARLRSAQLEHFRILCKIRQLFYDRDLELWNAVELSGATIPRPTHRSGTYMWLLLIILVASFAAGTGTYLLVYIANAWVTNGVAWSVAVAVGVAAAGAMDALYFTMAQARQTPPYLTPPLIE